MNADQIEIVLQYLKIETNYAVIINGKYGVGKTHFYKNELLPQIKEISLSKNETKKYTPIHISLFGFKSLEEIQTAIFVELFPILKSRNLKLAAGIGKSIIRGIVQIIKAGDIDKYLGDLNQDANNWLKYDELVICFDDIDRKSDSLDLKDVFGFINSLVENQGAKILIIANEEELIKDTHYTSKLIEKVIGVSIQYKPNPKAVYDQIINNLYSSSSKIYFQFLSEYRDTIVDVIEINQNNFRNLIFFLEHFRTIFNSIENIFQTDKAFLVLKDEKLKAILDFTLAITIEYKLGLLNSTNLDEVKGISEDPFANMRLNLFSNDSQKDKDLKSTYIDTFKKKYFSNSRYYFFKTIFEYITGTKAFNINNLKNELDLHFIVKNGEVPEQDKILNDLGYRVCLNLSDKEYKKLTLKMLGFLDAGKYQLPQYITVFHFATRFNNLLNFDIIKLKNRFKKGILRGKSNYKYTPDLDFYMHVYSEIEFKGDVIEIVKYCLQINESFKETDDKNEMDNLFKLFQLDFDAFIEKIKTRDSKFRFSPFWIEFDIKKIVTRINKLDNDNIWGFGNYFTDRYRRNIYDKLYPEKEFVITLRELIERPTKKRNKKTLHSASLNHLTKCLKECELNFP